MACLYFVLPLLLTVVVVVVVCLCSVGVCGIIPCTRAPVAPVV